MRWVRYSDRHGLHHGILNADHIEQIEGDMFSDWRKNGVTHALRDVQLEVPVIPGTFFAAGLNYAAHVLEAAKMTGTLASLPTHADVGYRANNALLRHEGVVIIPADATEAIQYEAEIVAVIGRKAHRVSERDAMDHVFGYTIGNDVSERNWQKQDRTFFRSKNSDTFKPMGPWIETEVNLDQARTTVHVNGKETIRFQTLDMIFSIAEFISRTSKYCTLLPGDVMWMGTDGTSPNIRHKDVVEIEITGLGVLRNQFLLES